ncbi:MAG: hypothetical protein E7565_04695 [Ruminococcaceae bacterium]|nr:hypothetical protein [Oscillospiraceae bacterium]
MEKFFFGDAELLVLNKGDGFSFLGGDIKGMKVEPSSLFTIKAKNSDTKEIFWLEGNSGWSKATAETKGNKTLFSLSDNEAFLGLTVKITFKTEGRALLIDTEVENRNDTLSVLDITYPVPTLSCDRFDLFYPRASGCVAKDAGRKGLTYSAPYPQLDACMQYFAAYNEVGGLYIGIEDPTASTKRFILKAENGRARFNLYFNAVGGGKPKNSFKLAGVCRLEAFEGDWYEASMLYFRFVKGECKWLPKLGEKGRTDLPDRFANIPFWVSDFIPNTPYQRENKPQNLSAGSDIYDKDYWIDAVIELKEKLGTDLAYHVYNWHHIPFNIEYPHFLPAKEGFKEGAEKLRENGVAILPYINSVSWEMDDADAGYEMNFANTGIHGATVNHNGDITYVDYPQTTLTGKTSRLAPICPDFKGWHDHIRKLSTEMNETLPIDGIYFDEIAAHASRLCCNPEHSHPPYGGSYWVEGYQKLMEGVNAEKPKDKYYFTECNAEPYINSFDGFLTWMWVHGGQVPAFSAVYGGYVQFIGRCTNGVKKEDFEFFKHSVASCLHYGQIMGWCKADIIYSEKHMKFLPPFVRLRAKYGEFFRNAEMKKPPVVKSNLPDKITGAGLWFTEEVTMPQVDASLWQNRTTKEQVLFITNISEESAEAEITYTVNGNPQTLKTTLPPYECRAVEI